MFQRSCQRCRRRLAHAAAQRAEKHEARGGQSRQCLGAVGPEPLAGMARFPWTRRRIHLRCGAVCLKDASPDKTSAIWAEAHQKCWLA